MIQRCKKDFLVTYFVSHLLRLKIAIMYSVIIVFLSSIVLSFSKLENQDDKSAQLYPNYKNNDLELNVTYPHYIRILLELLSAWCKITHLSSYARFGIFSNGGFSTPSILFWQPKLICFDCCVSSSRIPIIYIKSVK